MEIWKSIKGFDKYLVSNKGRILSFYKNKNGIYLKQTTANTGYYSVTLISNAGDKHFKSVHRLVCIAFNGDPKKGLVVNHIDGDRKNNNIKNLEWVTQAENVAHAKRSGKIRKGVNHPMSKLSEDDILEIRKLYSDGVRPTDLAKKYGCGYPHIWRIVKRKLWPHI